MSNLTGTVTGVNKLDSSRVNVTVEIDDSSTPLEQQVEGSLQTLTVPMPIDRVKSMGIGARVELTLKKMTVPRAKKAETASAGAGDEGAQDAEEGQENDDPAPAATTPIVPPAAGRRRAAATT